MKELRFEKIVKYYEDKERIGEFNIKTRFDKILMIFLFIIFFPITALLSWSLEFASLLSIKRKVYWRKIK